MSLSDGGDLLTLEPLVDAVRVGVERAGWTLSGLQKTTSYQFEGRWEGESTRSAYLFFHREEYTEGVSIDVYLDETSQGLAGNLALVVDLSALADVGDPADALRVFGALAGSCLPAAGATPVTLRLRLRDAKDDPGTAETEVRFKARLPRRTVREGADAVCQISSTLVEGFERILASSELERYRIAD